jgi:hypothetical protein
MTPEAIKVTHTISTSLSCGELARLGQVMGDHSCLGFNHVIFNGLQEQKGPSGTRIMVGPREHAISLPEHLVLGRIQKICKYFRVYFHELIRAKMNDYLHNSSQNDEIAMGS